MSEWEYDTYFVKQAILAEMKRVESGINDRLNKVGAKLDEITERLLVTTKGASKAKSLQERILGFVASYSMSGTEQIDDVRTKISIFVDSQAMEVLRIIEKDSRAVNLAEVLRNAIGLLDWARIQIKNGYTIGAFKDGVPAKEVILPFDHLVPKVPTD